MSLGYTLGVSSPLVQDRRVEAAQKVLNGSNVFGRDFHRGVVDGIFGETTGRSCKRAKYWLGYPVTELKATYGPHLHAFLKGEKQPDQEMVKRSSARLKEAAKTPLRTKALAEAVEHIGVKESPAGSNEVLFSRWYGMRGPWCAMFTTYCYVRGAGSQALVKGKRYAYVPYIVADARAGRNGLQVTLQPKPGDLACYDWDGGVADHVGLYEASLGSGQFRAIEGNTGIGNDSNGGQVMRRQRKNSQVECFVRVGR